MALESSDLSQAESWVDVINQECSIRKTKTVHVFLPLRNRRPSVALLEMLFTFC